MTPRAENQLRALVDANILITYLAQALLAAVDVIVTRGRDLIDLDGELGLRIFDPVAFLAMIPSTRN